MKYEDILKAQEGLKTMPIKGKDYVMVNERVKAFRKLYPEGCIDTEIVSLENGMVVCKTRVYSSADHVSGSLLATGLAFEREEANHINKTSFIENCETSSVGRALGFLGIGIDAGIASAEEMTRAIEQQGNNARNDIRSTVKVTEDQIKYVEKLCESKGMKGTPGYKGVFWKDMTIEQYTEAVDVLKKAGAKA